MRCLQYLRLKHTFRANLIYDSNKKRTNQNIFLKKCTVVVMRAFCFTPLIYVYTFPCSGAVLVYMHYIFFRSIRIFPSYILQMQTLKFIIDGSGSIYHHFRFRSIKIIILLYWFTLRLSSDLILSLILCEPNVDKE